MKIKAGWLGLMLGGFAAASVAAALPDLNADDYFEGSTPGTFGKKIATVLPHSNRVAVAGFRVVFTVQDSVSAQVRASYLPGRDMTGAHASMTVALKGVDAATMQALTDQAYAQFLQQLAAAGREVVPLEQIQPLYADLKLAKTSADTPYQKEVGGRTGLAFSPTGLPLWWTHADYPTWGDQGMISQGNYKKAIAFSKDVNAFVITPTFVVDFASMESSGNRSGLMAKEASVGAQLQMAVTNVDSLVARADEVKFGQLSSGDEGYIRGTRKFHSETEFGTMETVEERKTSGLLAVMTGSSKSKTSNAAQTDNARYSAPAAEVLAQATGALAKFFQQHSP